MKNSLFINKISATCFGVLLIHGNSDTMRRWLWQDVLDNVGMYDSSWWLVHAISSVLGVFIVCAIIDMARIKFLEQPFFILYDKKYDGLSLWYKQKKTSFGEKLGINQK